MKKHKVAYIDGKLPYINLLMNKACGVPQILISRSVMGEKF